MGDGDEKCSRKSRRWRTPLCVPRWSHGPVSLFVHTGHILESYGSGSRVLIYVSTSEEMTAHFSFGFLTFTSSTLIVPTPMSL